MPIKTYKQLFIRHNHLQKGRRAIFFLHGFGDSGLVYKEAFESVLNTHFNLYVIDLPGFGASPLNHDYTSIQSHADLLVETILHEVDHKAELYLIAHSIGALIGTWICQQLPDRIGYYFNVEGNLTPSDSYFSSKPLQYETPEQFFEAFEKEVFEQAKKEERFRRYYSSLRFAEPQAMRNWAETSQEYVKDNKCGLDFEGLSCRKLYLWGDLDTPQETREFIKNHHLPNRCYKGVGHWHMHENPAFYQDIYNSIVP